MSALQPAVAFAATFLESTLVGVFIELAMMEHAARRTPAETWVAYNQAKATVNEPVMPVFFDVTLALSVPAVSILPTRVEQ